MAKIYLIGSLKQGRVREIAELLREGGHKVFDDWHACGPEADMHWQTYEMERGRNYVEAINAPFRVNASNFDLDNLSRSSIAVAVCKPNRLPGVASVAELGWFRFHYGKGGKTIVLLDGEPEQWDMMLPIVVDKFCYDIKEVLEEIKND